MRLREGSEQLRLSYPIDVGAWQRSAQCPHAPRSDGQSPILTRCFGCTVDLFGRGLPHDDPKRGTPVWFTGAVGGSRIVRRGSARRCWRCIGRSIRGLDRRWLRRGLRLHDAGPGGEQVIGRLRDEDQGVDRPGLPADLRKKPSRRRAAEVAAAGRLVGKMTRRHPRHSRDFLHLHRRKRGGVLHVIEPPRRNRRGNSRDMRGLERDLRHR